MKIIYNKYFPFRPFLATNIFGIIFCRGRKGCMDATIQNHEYIHTLQQRELLFVGFVIWYYAEWLLRAIQCRSLMKGYRHISFEREAYANERNLNYKNTRRPFAWCRMLSKKKPLIHKTH